VTSDAAPAEIARGAVRIDPARHSASFGGTEVALTAIEFDLLKALFTRPETVFSRERIMALAYPSNTHVSDRTIDSHIRNIRAKFLGSGCDGVIDTVHGVGFRAGRCEPAR
jgi:two-component system OmpR family response regulator